MTRAPGRIPIEYRLALGASSRHDLFDGTGILSLCYRDPWVNVDNGGNLVFVRVRHNLTPELAPRIAGAKETPRRRFSTGYGVKIGWDIEIQVETSRLGILAEDYPTKPEINDGSLWHLASIMGTTRSLLDFEAGSFPPYLYLCSNYQSVDEQWIPVEIDPDNATIDPITLEPGGGAGVPDTMSMRFRLLSRDNYRLVVPEYVPSFDVFDLNDENDVPSLRITAMPRMVASGEGFRTQVTLDGPLPTSHPRARDGLGPLDGLLVNLGETTYGWKRFTILSIDNPERTLVTLIAATDITGDFTIPPSGPCDRVRGVVQNSYFYLPQYCIVPFVGDPPEKKQRQLTGAWLIGRRGCPPGSGEPTAPPFINPEPPPPVPPPDTLDCLTILPGGVTPEVFEFTSGSGTWNPPRNKTWALFTVIAGGGGGAAGCSRGWGGTGDVGGGGGGGGGAKSTRAVLIADLPNGIPYTVGPGGLGGAATAFVDYSNDGAPGGTSSVGNPTDDWYTVAYGGAGGVNGHWDGDGYGGGGGGGEGPGGTGTTGVGPEGGSPTSGSGVNGTGTGGGGATPLPTDLGNAECGGAAGAAGGSSSKGGSSKYGGGAGGGGGSGYDGLPQNAKPGGEGGICGAYTRGGGATGGAALNMLIGDGTSIAGAGDPGAPGVDGSCGGGGGGGGGAVAGGGGYLGGGPGGDGGYPGGGGGGGGAGSGLASGKGGDGAGGLIRIECW